MDLLTVKRYNLKPDWTIGALSLQGEPIGFTIEDEIRQVKVHGETAIPYGSYSLGYRQSPKFSDAFWWSDTANRLVPKNVLSSYSHLKDLRPHDLIHVQNVPDFEYILFHWGNFDDDTDGCLIVGSSIGFAKNRKGILKEAVLNSKEFYRSFYQRAYPLIKKGSQKITITYAK